MTETADREVRAIAVDTGTFWIGDPGLLVNKLAEQERLLRMDPANRGDALEAWDALTKGYLAHGRIHEPLGENWGLWMVIDDGLFDVTINRDATHGITSVTVTLWDLTKPEK